MLGLVILGGGQPDVFPTVELPTVLLSIRNFAMVVTVAALAALLIAIYAGRWFESLLKWIEHGLCLAARLPAWRGQSRQLRGQPLTLAALIAASVCVHTLLALKSTSFLQGSTAASNASGAFNM